MSSIQDYESPTTLTEGPEEEPVESHQGPLDERHQASSTPQERLGGGPNPTTTSPTVQTTTLRNSSPPRFSQVVDQPSGTSDIVTQAILAAGLELTNANQPVGTGYGGTDNANLDAGDATSNNANTNPTGARDIVTTSGTSGGITAVNRHPDRGPALSSSRPPPERRQTGPGLTIYDTIRGDSAVQVHVQPASPDVNGDGEPVGVPGRRGSRNTLGRISISRPRSVFQPVDGGGNGPGSRRLSRMASLHDVPVVQEPREKTVEDRLRPTIESATVERDKFQRQAKLQGILINTAIGLQVAFGAITTGVAAAASDGARHVGQVIAALGAISTLLASYLASVRGSGEPEFSTIRERELNTFLREIEAFIMDHGHKTGTEQDDKIIMYRERFETIIKTDGEDTGDGIARSRGPPPPNSRTLPPPPPPGTVGPLGYADEKQYMCITCRNERLADEKLADENV